MTLPLFTNYALQFYAGESESISLLVIGLMWGSRDQLWSLLQQAGPATLLLNLSGIFLGLLAGRLGGLSHRFCAGGLRA